MPSRLLDRSPPAPIAARSTLALALSSFAAWFVFSPLALLLAVASALAARRMRRRHPAAPSLAQARLAAAAALTLAGVSLAAALLALLAGAPLSIAIWL